MPVRPVPAAGSHRESSPERPGRESDPTALVAGLERVRDGLHRCLDRLEEEVRAAIADGSRAGDLEATRRELDEERSRLRDEAERHEHEWQGLMEALEHDRRLLAEAWEELERERIAGGPPVSPHPPSPRTGPEAGSGIGRHPEPSGEDAVARAVLRQFETLRHDVRLRAEVRPPRRPR